MPVDVRKRVRPSVDRLTRAAVDRGLPPSWTGYRWVRRVSLAEYARQEPAARCEVLQPATTVSNPLPRNVSERDELPDDAGWWGHSFRTVPKRESHATLRGVIHDARVVSYRDEASDGDWVPALLTRDGRSLDLREVRFRPRHAAAARSRAPQRYEQATWILERVFHNHSHWLTAHLPKLLLLQEVGGLDDVLLPAELPPALEQSLHLVGLDAERFRRVDVDRPVVVQELTVLDTDRFRPELVRRVQEVWTEGAPPPGRRIYISRARATRRRLVNEEELWPALRDAGFERVVMEDLSFRDQAELMRQTAVVMAPHGAGLTNMMLCPPGTQVVEIADLSFPNPNFYALACGARHGYWLLPAQSMGGGRPLERDLRVDVSSVEALLPAVLA